MYTQKKILLCWYVYTYINVCIHNYVCTYLCFFILKMFKLNENCEVLDQRILKCDYIGYSPAEISTINTSNSQIVINIPREDSVVPLLYSYLDLNFEVIKKVDISRYGNDNDKQWVSLGPIVSFSNFELTTSSGKLLEDISHVDLVSLMNKLITSRKDSDDLSIGFDLTRTRRRDELPQNKHAKGKYHLRIMLKDVFGFAEHQKKATFGLGNKLTLTRKKDDAAMDRCGYCWC